jgi:hypothetical protein
MNHSYIHVFNEEMQQSKIYNVDTFSRKLGLTQNKIDTRNGNGGES